MSLQIIEAINTPSTYQFDGDTAELRLYCTLPFITSNGQMIGQGSPISNQSWYLSVTCEVQPTGILYVPSFQVDSTTDGQPRLAKYIAALFTEGGAYIGPFPNTNPNGFAIPPPSLMPNPTWGQLAIYNRLPTLLYPPPTFPTRDEMYNAIAAAIGDLDLASSTNLGVTALDVDPIDPSFPIAVGANSPLLPQLASSTVIGITELDVDPDDPFEPIAVGVNSPLLNRGGTQFISDDYISLNAAVTAIGSTPGALFIQEAGFPSGLSTTVPSTLVLDFGDIGTIAMVTGQMATILSDVSLYPDRPLFSNALAGEGTVSFASATVIDTIKPIWWASGDFGQKLTAAIAALPSGGGTIDTRTLTGAQSLSADVTINKVGAIILFGEIVLAMGTNRFVIPVNTTGVELIGVGSGAPEQPSIAATGTRFDYTGSTYAIVIGDTSAQTSRAVVRDIGIVPTHATGGALNPINVLGGDFQRLWCRHGDPANSTGIGALVHAGAGTGTTYAAFNNFIDCTVGGFKTGYKFSGAGAFACNANNIVRGFIFGTAPLLSGSIGVDIANGAGNRIDHTNIDAVEFGVKCRTGTKWNLGNQINFDQVGATFTVDIEAGSDLNQFIINSINGTTTDTQDLGTDNTIWDQRLIIGFDTPFEYIKAQTTIPLEIRSADNVRKLAIGDLDVVLQAGDNGGTGMLALNKDGGTAGVRFGDGAGDANMFVVAPSGITTVRVGSALTVSSNTITPVSAIHHVGAGLIKTITVPNFLNGTVNGGDITLIPDAAFTYDATGNIASGTGTAVIGRPMVATWDPVAAKWYMSYS